MRTFISIDIPKQVKEEIKKTQDQIPNFFGKKTELENLHLTLKFFGEIDKEKLGKIRKKLREIKYPSFDAEIDSIGVFSEKFVRIIWLHISSCEELQKLIDEKLKDLFEEEKRFMSHLTIARVKSLNDKKGFLTKLREIKIPKIKFRVENFELNESILRKQGPLYKVLEEYGLEKYRQERF